MLLSIKWLKTLGKISWDFKKLEMQLCLKGEVFSLKGFPNGKLRVVEEEVSCKMLSCTDELCVLHTKF